MQLAGGARCASFTAPGPVITPAIGGIRVPGVRPRCFIGEVGGRGKVQMIELI